MTWLRSTDHWPRWKDSGKRVQIETHDGDRHAGRLMLDRALVLEDADAPLYSVHTDDGARIPFGEVHRWRFE